MLDEKFARRSRRSRSRTTKAIQLGYDYAKEHFKCPLPFRLAKMDATSDNDPHRRQHRDRARLPLRRRDGRGLVSDHAVDQRDGRVQVALREATATTRRPAKNSYCILQAEDELAAIGMVIGASWNGARAFTSTAGPGHLADERAHRPRLLRGDPGGDRRRPARRPVDRDADAHAAGRHPARAPTPRTATPSTSCLFPANPAECFYLAVESVRPRRALPDAGLHAHRPRHRHERLGVPALHVGRRVRARPRQGPHHGAARGDAEVLPLLARGRRRMSRRARSPASHPKGAFFTRGSGHNKLGGYTEIPDEYQDVMDRLAAQAQGGREGRARRRHRREREGAKVGVVSIGGCDAAVREALERARRARASRRTTCASARSPSTSAVEAFLASHEKVFVVEQNRDAQLRTLLMLETRVPRRSSRPCSSTAASRSAPSTSSRR